jgi:chemotaxis protein CheD
LAKNIYVVPIGEMVTSDNPDDVLVAYGLGSCVAICLHDPVARVGGMLHALLPAAHDNGRAVRGKPTKFVDQGTTLLIDELLRLNARRTRLVAYLCGGARMLSTPEFDDLLSIGERNELAAEAALRATGLRIQARATGGHSGRTVRFYIATGQLVIRTLEHGEQDLNATFRRPEWPR